MWRSTSSTALRALRPRAVLLRGWTPARTSSGFIGSISGERTSAASAAGFPPPPPPPPPPAPPQSSSAGSTSGHASGSRASADAGLPQPPSPGASSPLQPTQGWPQVPSAPPASAAAVESSPRSAASAIPPPPPGGAPAALPPPPPLPSSGSSFPPPPPASAGVAGATSGRTLGGGAAAPAPGLPLPPTPPPASSAIAAATPVTGGEARPLSAQEQYDRLKHFLPMTKEPNTPRPSPGELRVGTRLRVEWSNGWWSARVSEENETQVKISFTSWSSRLDEWIARDSPRLRLPEADDVEPPDMVSEGGAAVPGFGPPSGFAGVASTRSNKPFTPKPYNPEKEFQKRQLRLKEKIAAMQREKLGAVDPALSEFAVPRSAPQVTEPVGHAAAIPPPPSMPEAAPAARVQPLPSPGIPPPPPPSMQVASEIPSPPPLPELPPLPQSQSLQQQPRQQREHPQSLQQPGSGAAAAMGAALAGSAVSRAIDAAPAPPVSPKLPEVAPAPPPPPAAAAPSSPGPGPVVRWEECLTDDKEYYYHEVATGRVQWELPSEGWAALVAEDGAVYYWDPVLDKTQWDRPTAHAARATSNEPF
eukprot:TRINITY_DN1181_c0_g1_i1.p1 TRINITY_DN1181_c0_g1~~TRINITY_DN1181_c0_g1_i1.p1  ORF type:complete len:589 (-),score=121.64 TRINITY_DN1181_c0_g1_i1:50-1816(-)